MDMLGAEAPILNMNGRSTIKTYTGASISIVMMCVTTLFALLKLQHLLMRKNPDVTELVE